MALNFTVVSTFQFALQQIINKQLCQRNCQGNISLETSLDAFVEFFLFSALPLSKGEATFAFPLSLFMAFYRECHTKTNFQ
jgi:hypothetical protein